MGVGARLSGESRPGEDVEIRHSPVRMIHRIERLRQLVELIVRLHLHNLVEIPFRDFLQGTRHRLQRTQNRPAHQEGKDNGQPHADDGQAVDPERQVNLFADLVRQSLVELRE